MDMRWGTLQTTHVQTISQVFFRAKSSHRFHDASPPTVIHSFADPTCKPRFSLGANPCRLPSMYMTAVQDIVNASRTCQAFNACGLPYLAPTPVAVEST